jgi:hypothetical protein
MAPIALLDATKKKQGVKCTFDSFVNVSIAKDNEWGISSSFNGYPKSS